MKFYKYLVWLFLLLPAHAFATRERQSLEAFDVNSLAVKAIYFNKSRGYSYAIIRDPGGYVHRAYKGDYLGKNFGRIVELSRKKGVRALEAVQNEDGEWVEREVWIPFEQK